jgi:hypothetical protein
MGYPGLAEGRKTGGRWGGGSGHEEERKVLERDTESKRMTVVELRSVVAFFLDVRGRRAEGRERMGRQVPDRPSLQALGS